MGWFGRGRKRQQEEEPDYRALIEAAEERARLATEAWASAHGYGCDGTEDEGGMLEDAYEPVDLEQAPLTSLLDCLYRKRN
jgi:hypothetical protein